MLFWRLCLWYTLSNASPPLNCSDAEGLMWGCMKGGEGGGEKGIKHVEYSIVRSEAAVRRWTPRQPFRHACHVSIYLALHERIAKPYLRPGIEVCHHPETFRISRCFLKTKTQHGLRYLGMEGDKMCWGNVALDVHAWGGNTKYVATEHALRRNWRTSDKSGYVGVDGRIILKWFEINKSLFWYILLYLMKSVFCDFYETVTDFRFL
jgi:hypothetical protein